ncbi:MAG: hypothetical protein J4F41_09145 [Alphaproteobacteria bacterium]|nr:hypothetical protein [Alphaproteobacteria bacterium]
MQQVDPGIRDGCVILPFVPPQLIADQVETTSLAALIAVTVLHDASISPEDRLIEIIEQSGEVEVLDSDEAFADFGLEELDTTTGPALPDAANDNSPLTAI